MMPCKPFAMQISEDREKITSAKAKRGTVIREFNVHKRHVFGVAMTGAHLITCSADGTCQVFDSQTLLPVLTYRGHASIVNTVNSIREQGYPSDLVLTASRDCSAKLWNCVTGETILNLCHGGPVKSAAASNGMIFTFSLPNNTLTIWRLCDGILIHSYESFYALASPLSVSLPYLVFGTFGSLLHICTFNEDPLTNNTRPSYSIAKLAGHSKGILSCAIHRDGKRVLSGSEDRTALLFQIATGKVLARFCGHADSIVSVDFANNHRSDLAITTSLDKSARIWDIDTGVCCTVLYCSDAVCSGVLNGRGLAFIGCADNSAILYDISEGGFRKISLLCYGSRYCKGSNLHSLPIEIFQRVKTFLI
jgi:WD40 repeat protein